ncbi:Gfo/Idh/MocA family protein [Amycolatopsis sp. NPDC059657]|uniref:Gfo/Idh/MocA family protein n=1 Tax=Amycolatopsis sp. NPDC059657 TaxID=3346899 RepID=UPI0036731F6E
MTPPKVVVFGTSGYAEVHLRRARALHDRAEIVLAGVCDVREPSAEAIGILPSGTLVFTDAQQLLERATPDIAIVATPPHTHLMVALTALAAGCHVLVEKPPVLDLDAFAQLAGCAERAGVSCQVGFQSFGSRALPTLRAAIGDGAIGALTGVGAAGAWIRRDAYYGRNAWAGRRQLNGVSVVDGSLTNPFAHAVATAILVTGQASTLPRAIEVELYHARQIEADDTAAARLLFDGGIEVVAAATLCADDEVEPYVVVHGTQGKARWWYRTNMLEINGRPVPLGLPIGLLRDLVTHVRDKTPLAAPLAHTRAFTAFVQAVRDHPGPKSIPPAWVGTADEGTERRYVVDRIAESVETAADEMLLYSELGVPWAS